ncbi:MAG: PEP-CTERM sorting domain-containing protein, partial [Thermoguttaceae bacterium]
NDSIYDNTITSVSGRFVGFNCPVIHADRSYQTSDVATGTGQVMSIGNVVLDNPSTNPNDVSAIAFGSDSQYLRTNNEYIITGKRLILGTASNAKDVYVNNGNITAGRAGNRYLGGVNDMNISMNEARFLGDSNNVGLDDSGQTLNKYGPGVLEIDGDNSTSHSSTGIKTIWEGVLRFATADSVGPLGTPITIYPDAGLGIGWNNGLPIGMSIIGTLPGSSGALDIDGSNYTGTLAFHSDTSIRGLRLGSSSRSSSSRSGGTISGTIWPQPAANGIVWYLLGGGGGTLTIHSNLNEPVGVEMATTGNLLPGRVILDPASPNWFTGRTRIYAGTLQPTSRMALEVTPMVSVNTTCTDFDGTYIKPKSTSQVDAGTYFSFEGPGQLLLDPSVNYAFPLGMVALDGGAVGWTGNKVINSIAADVGTYGMPLNSFLWWSEKYGGSEYSVPTNLLHLGGEYSQGTMKFAANCSITDNVPIPVALVKSGLYSTLDLSTNPGAINTYTGGTAIIGGELIVSDSKQVCGDRTILTGGPILIANGGVLHVTDTTTFDNCLRIATRGTPDTDIGMSRMTTLCNGSVIQVDDNYIATFTGLIDGRPALGSSRMYTTITPLEKTGSGTLYLDYLSPSGTERQYPYVNTYSNHWGLKLTEGWVSTNQLPYVVTTPNGTQNGAPDRSNGYIVCNGGNLEIRSPPSPPNSFNFHDDYTYGGSFLTYGFFGLNSFQGTESTIKVHDGALFRVSAVSPMIFMGTVIFDAQDDNGDPTDNLFHLRMAADLQHEPEEDTPPGGDSRGTGTLDLRGGMVILTTRDFKNILPQETEFTLKLNGGIFNGQLYSTLNGNLIINEQSASGTPQIDGENYSKDWLVAPAADIWTIQGTGTTSWRGTLEKIGTGTVEFNREKGAPVIIDSTTDTLKISNGIVNIGGSGDPFTDTATPTVHVNILNNASFNITQGTKDVAAISGTGVTSVSLGATLLVGSDGPVTQGNFTIYGSADVGSVVVSDTTTVGDGTTPAYLWADSINSDTLTIGAGSTVTIKPIPGGPSGLEITPVPEPSTFVLLILGAAGLLGCSYRWRK